MSEIYIRVTQVLDKVFPDVKRIMIERKEEDLFKQIIQNKGKVNLKIIFDLLENGLSCESNSYGRT